MLPFPRKLHHLVPIAAALVTVAASATAFAPPITSAANAPHSGISPGGVDMSTGEIILVCRPDLALDGPMPVVFDRYYASMLGREGLASGRMGPNWLGTYDWKLNVSGSTADVITGRGKDVKFQMPPAGGPWMLVSPLDQAYVLSFSGGTYRFTDPTAQGETVFEPRRILAIGEDAELRTRTVPAQLRRSARARQPQVAATQWRELASPTRFEPAEGSTHRR